MADTRYVTHNKWTSLTATQVTYPNGRQVASGYDALYRRNSVTEVSTSASIAAWQFFGNRTATVVLGNGIICSFMNNAQTNSAVQAGVPNPAWGDNTTDRLGYDGSGRLIAKRFLPPGTTTCLVGFTTDYDPSSNKLFERTLHAESRSAVYPGYDSMDRLLEYQRGVLASGGESVTTPITLPGTDSQRTYDLDSLGNWKNTVYAPEGGTSTTEIRQHNKLNEITIFGSTPVLYDHGNNTGNSNPLIARRGNGNIANDGTRICAYDALNRLTTVSSMAGGTPQVAGYTYDALGRRVLKVVTNGGIPGSIADATYRYLYDSQRIVEELLFVGSTYSTLRQFAWGHYIDELIQLNIPATTTTPPLDAGTYYPLQDTLFQTTATTNTSGSIVEVYDYDAYGNTLMYSGPGSGGIWFTDNDVSTLQPVCEFLFTGRQYDPESQIYSYRGRYYQPKLGRFVSRDRRRYSDGPNLFQYVLDNPLVRTDPFGDQATQESTGCKCGTDVTAQLSAIRFSVWQQWSQLAQDERKALVRERFDPWHAVNGWDIFQLAFRKTIFNTANCGTGPCANTVTVDGDCYAAEEVNYYLWGLLMRLMDDDAKHHHHDLDDYGESASLDSGLISVSEYRNLYPPARRGRLGKDYWGTGSNTQGRHAWTIAGFLDYPNAAWQLKAAITAEHNMGCVCSPCDDWNQVPLTWHIGDGSSKRNNGATLRLSGEEGPQPKPKK